MLQTADGSGASMQLHLAGIRVDTVGPMGPRRWLRQCSGGELGAQRGPGDQGNKQAERSDDCDGQLPSPRLGRQPQRAVKTVKVRCVLPQRVCLRPTLHRGDTRPLAHLPIATAALYWLGLSYRRAMGTIRPERRFAIRLFLRSLASWKPGEIEPGYVYEDLRE
jgi:hypothetical protein